MLQTNLHAEGSVQLRLVVRDCALFIIGNLLRGFYSLHRICIKGFLKQRDLILMKIYYCSMKVLILKFIVQ